MYDNRQKWSNLRPMSEQQRMQCLLDFSQGPRSVLVTALKKSAECNISERTASFSDFKMESSDREEPVALKTSTIQVRKPDIKPRAVCSFCGKEFSHLGDHNKHKRRHTGERPYGCDLCPLKFAHASNLARHRRLHSGEKPFSCKGCGRGFARKDKLNAHMARKRCGGSPSPIPGRETKDAGPPED